MLGFGKSLHRMWKTNEGAEGPVLREIWSLPSRLVANLSPHVASKLLQSKPRCTVQARFKIAVPENDEGAKWKKTKDLPRFLSARPGDMLGAPFQCDHCWFVNINKREPEVSSLGDTRIMQYIRRVNLDVMWSRESGTVKNILGTLRKGKISAKS